MRTTTPTPLLPLLLLLLSLTACAGRSASGASTPTAQRPATEPAAAEPKAAAASTVDERAVVAVVDSLFDAMRSADTATIRSLFHPDARLVSAGERDGRPSVRVLPVDAFVDAIGRPHDEVYDERVRDVEVRVDGGLGVAWMRYTFHLGERLSHCGVDAFQVVRMPDGWKIVQIADTERREGCAE